MTLRKHRHLDPADFLPHRPLELFLRGQAVHYDAAKGAVQAWLVTSGFFAITHPETGTFSEVLGPEDFWIGAENPHLRCLSDGRLMRWSFAELQGAAVAKPELGLALVNVSSQTLEGLRQRHAFTLRDTYDRSIVRHLLDLLARFGEASRLQLGWLTHEFLAGYVGATRPIASKQLGRLRRLGLISYGWKRGEFQADIPALERYLEKRQTEEMPL